MTDLLPPGDMPAWADEDPANTIAGTFRDEMWPSLWPRTVHSYANAAARDADLPGLAPTATAFAWLRDKKWLTAWTGTEWKPVHPVSGFAAVTFSSGVGTLTHNLGFVPAIITIGARLDTAPVFVTWSLGVGTTTATTCQVRAWNVASGTAYTGSLSVVTFVASA